MPIESDTLQSALEQLDCAADLYMRGAFRAATALAGAAEELTGKALPDDARARARLIERLRALSGDDADAIGDRLNRPRNYLKHGTRPPEAAEWEQHAAEVIFRAAANLLALGHQVPESVLPVYRYWTATYGAG